MKRQLILEDGTYFIGEEFGSKGDTVGEVIFNTGMTGYQETLSNPSNCGQIITFTYPLIGNAGVNREDFEAIEPFTSGIIVGEVADVPSHWQSDYSLDEFLKTKNIPGIQGIDTRKLMRLIRSKGTLKGKITSLDVDRAKIVAALQATSLEKGQVKQVSTKAPYQLPGNGYRVVVADFGLKKGILKELIAHNFDVIVVPFDVKAEEVLRLNPDGILLSNGPGNPKDIPVATEMIQEIIGKVPLMGVGLGHQLLALACGANTSKMKFGGHRGANHPVKELSTGKVEITTQNHGYIVDAESIKDTELVVTHLAVNDETVEGICHRSLPAFSMQYLPDASPGTQESNQLFANFLKLIEQHRKAGNKVCQNV